MDAEISTIDDLFLHSQPSDMGLHIDDAAIYQQLEEALDMELLENSTYEIYSTPSKGYYAYNIL